MPEILSIIFYLIFLILSIFVPASPPAVMTSGKVKNGRDPEPLKTIKKKWKVVKKRKNSQIQSERKEIKRIQKKMVYKKIHDTKQKKEKKLE